MANDTDFWSWANSPLVNGSYQPQPPQQPPSGANMPLPGYTPQPQQDPWTPQPTTQWPTPGQFYQAQHPDKPNAAWQQADPSQYYSDPNYQPPPGAMTPAQALMLQRALGHRLTDQNMDERVEGANRALRAAPLIPAGVGMLAGAPLAASIVGPEIASTGMGSHFMGDSPLSTAAQMALPLVPGAAGQAIAPMMRASKPLAMGTLASGYGATQLARYSMGEAEAKEQAAKKAAATPAPAPEPTSMPNVTISGDYDKDIAETNARFEKRLNDEKASGGPGKRYDRIATEQTNTLNAINGAYQKKFKDFQSGLDKDLTFPKFTESDKSAVKNAMDYKSAMAAYKTGNENYNEQRKTLGERYPLGMLMGEGAANLGTIAMPAAVRKYQLRNLNNLADDANAEYNSTFAKGAPPLTQGALNSADSALADLKHGIEASHAIKSHALEWGGGIAAPWFASNFAPNMADAILGQLSGTPGGKEREAQAVQNITNPERLGLSGTAGTLDTLLGQWAASRTATTINGKAQAAMAKLQGANRTVNPGAEIGQTPPVPPAPPPRAPVPPPNMGPGALGGRSWLDESGNAPAAVLTPNGILTGASARSRWQSDPKPVPPTTRPKSSPRKPKTKAAANED